MLVNHSNYAPAFFNHFFKLWFFHGITNFFTDLGATLFSMTLFCFFITSIHPYSRNNLCAFSLCTVGLSTSKNRFSVIFLFNTWSIYVFHTEPGSASCWVWLTSECLSYGEGTRKNKKRRKPKKKKKKKKKRKRKERKKEKIIFRVRSWHEYERSSCLLKLGGYQRWQLSLPASNITFMAFAFITLNARYFF